MSETLKHISYKTLDRVKANFVNAVQSLSDLSCDDIGEVALALELIGTGLRNSWATNDRALLMFAKVILDHANTTRIA